jgi:hypothetical protein
VAVHAGFETAGKTGMLGLLGGAWVQIVHVSDEPRANAYLTSPRNASAEVMSLRNSIFRENPRRK